MTIVFNEKYYEHLTEDDLANEEWRDIEGYEGLYQISNCGRVKSMARLTKTSRGNGVRPVSEKILKPGVNTNGYLYVDLCKESSKKHILIHRLVASAYIENPESKTQVNHISSIKTDNRSKSLEWATPRENTVHAWTNGLCENVRETARNRLYKINFVRKLSDSDCENIRIRYATGNELQRELAYCFGVGQDYISRIVNNKSRSRQTTTP